VQSFFIIFIKDVMAPRLFCYEYVKSEYIKRQNRASVFYIFNSFIEFLLNHVAFSTTAHVGSSLYKVNILWLCYTDVPQYERHTPKASINTTKACTVL